MAKTVSMETRLRAVLAADVAGVAVVELCRQLQISRDTFYRYRRRFQTEGPAGLATRSRRPLHSPNQIPPGVEDRIVRWRKQLHDLGVDHGAQTIFYHLRREGTVPLPGVATIHRVLVRRGLVAAQPKKRPKASYIRFEWPRPNDAWQIDATSWVLADGRQVWIMDLIDDHSRLVPMALACSGPTGGAAREAFTVAASRYGLPAHVMSDNGICFTARFTSRGETDFERDLQALGIGHILSSPGHPQTCGKLERFHQTLKGWLTQQTPTQTLDQLQTRLDTFTDYYNLQRPHRALGGATPRQRWQATPPAQPGSPLPTAPRASLHQVDHTGICTWRDYQVGIGQTHKHQTVLIISRGDQLAVFGPTGLIRTLTIDPTRRYQPTGQPRGRRPKPEP
jgi:transposase InsO family protein